MFEIVFTNKMKRDVKLMKKRGKDHATIPITPPPPTMNPPIELTEFVPEKIESVFVRAWELKTLLPVRHGPKRQCPYNRYSHSRKKGNFASFPFFGGLSGSK